MPLTIASTINPSTSSTTAAAMMTRLARRSRKPREARTCAVMPTLVATMAAPVKKLSIRGSPHSVQSAHPPKNGTMTPAMATTQRGAADLHQFRRLHLQPDAEEQEHDAEFRERGEQFGGSEPAKYVRPDQHSGENFAHDAGLANTLEEFRHQLGRGETPAAWRAESARREASLLR